MKKGFLNFTLLLVAAACLFVSCKKEKTSPESEDLVPSISFKVDGVQKTFKVAPLAMEIFSEEGFMVAMKAAPDSVSKESLMIEIIQKGKTFAPGTYTDEGPASDDHLIAGIYVASDDPDKTFIAGGRELDDPAPRFQIVITSVADGMVTGTFSGTFYEKDGAGPGKVTITDGKFNRLPVSNPQD